VSHAADRSDSKYRFRFFDGLGVEIDPDPFVIAAHGYDIERLAWIEVLLLMRDVRRKIDEVTGADAPCKFKPLSPANLSATFHDIDRNLGVAVMMYPPSSQPAVTRSSQARYCSIGSGEIDRSSCPLPEGPPMTALSDSARTMVTPLFRHFIAPITVISAD
jgi:hypothetical protein